MPLTQTINLAAQNLEPILSSRIANGETTLKPTPGRVDYYFSNYCAPCELKLSKEHLRCPECKQKGIFQITEPEATISANLILVSSPCYAVLNKLKEKFWAARMSVGGMSKKFRM